MKKNRRFDCFTLGCSSQILLKVKLLSVVLVTAFASLAADGRLLETKPMITPIPAEQQKKITGKVSDVAGVPIPGATIVASGTTIGTTTDIDGNFTLSVPAGTKSLLVSFVGMVSKDVTIGTNNNFMITLSESTVVLEEVVFVGYGTENKETMVGAVTQVNNATLMQAGATNVSNAIAGKLSGILTIQQRGEPGNNAADIYVRGLSSWN